MRFRVVHRYLNLPVKNGADKVVLQIRQGERLCREFEVELASGGQPDWWAFCDLTAFAGLTLELTVAPGSPGAASAERLEDIVRCSDAPLGLGHLYQETGRPQFHFTARRGWNNDPNGLVYAHNQWHLFFQHNPFGIRWGNMHWGHAVSADLVHWTELPTALYQHSLKDMAFSGGGLVDRDNSAGFCPGAAEVLVVSYTSTGRGECLAYSADGGLTLTEYGGNPVLRHRGRDPRVFWYAPGRKWVMVVYDEPDQGWRYAFYESTDLRTWRYMTAVDGFYECPDLFELPLDGDPRQRYWVLHGAQRQDRGGRREVSRSSYMVGRFDGRAFASATPVLNGHLGPHFYAAQTFANAPGGRVIMLGWLAGAQYPGMPFSQGLTVPLELSLRSTADGPRLALLPVAELAALRRATETIEAPSLARTNAALAAAGGELLDLELDLALTRESVVTLDLRGTPVTCDVAGGTLTALGITTALPLLDGRLALRALVDRGVVEIFAGNGLVALSQGGIFAKPNASLHLDIRGPGRVQRLTIAELSPAWPQS